MTKSYYIELDCVLMAPSKTERKPNEKIKTDKRDACKITGHWSPVVRAREPHRPG
ncbi:MAG: hypothetical protein QE267_09330 [Akkermansiaceae bacterium]|jgi:ribosomal protein S14|nr:hypothetical protein [Akkermansiaceae bacterium]